MLSVRCVKGSDDMREKLKKIGIGNEVCILGQYIRVGGKWLLVTDVHDCITMEYICDHMWIDKYYIDYMKEHDDFVVCRGKVYEYIKACGVKDYGVGMVNYSLLIKPFVFNDRLVFLMHDRHIRYWFYRYYPVYKSSDYPGYKLDEIKHLYQGNSEEAGYEIMEETDEYYILSYEKRNSTLKVYKKLEYAIAQIHLI